MRSWVWILGTQVKLDAEACIHNASALAGRWEGETEGLPEAWERARLTGIHKEKKRTSVYMETEEGQDLSLPPDLHTHSTGCTCPHEHRERRGQGGGRFKGGSRLLEWILS